MRLHKKAYTLVEVLIALALFALISEAIYAALMVGQRSWTNFNDNITPKQDLRRALISMSAELREAKNIFIVKDDHSVKINFEKPGTGAVDYHWSSTGEDAYKVIRKNYNDQRALAGNISALDFRTPDSDEVIVDITAGIKQKFSLTEKIALRAQTSLFAKGQNEKIK